MPYVKTEEMVPAQVMGPEAPGVTVRWVIDAEHDHAPHYALRVITVPVGSYTPHHTHNYEHENYILEGEGTVQIGDEVLPVKAGNIVYVPPAIKHQYRNTGNRPFKFLCGIPIQKTC